MSITAHHPPTHSHPHRSLTPGPMWGLVLCLLLLLLAAHPAQAQWPQTIGGEGPVQSQGIAVDGSGDVYVTGYFRGENIDFGGTILSSTLNNFGLTSDIFIAKYTSAGMLAWVHAISTPSGQGSGIAVDGSGHVYVTGSFNGENVDFGGTLVSSNGYDIFIAKYTSAGALVWVHAIGNDSSGGGGHGHDIAVDGSGNVYVTGYFRGENIDFGGTILSSTSGSSSVFPTSDIFVAKYTSAGALTWAHGFGSNFHSDEGFSIAVDASSNVYVTGRFKDHVDFGNLSVSSNGFEDVFILKCDAAGNPVWVRSFGGPDCIECEGGFYIAVDASSNVYVTGRVSPDGGDIDFGGIIRSFNGAFLVKYDAAGTAQWVKNRKIGDIALDSSGNVYVGGTAKYDPAGTLLWSTEIDATSLDIAVDERAGASPSVYLTGSFNGTVDFHPDISGGWRTSNGQDAFIARYLASDGSGLFELERPPLVYQPKWRPLFPQLRFEFDILIGSDTHPVEDLFGVGFRFQFDPNVITFQGATPGSFLREDGTDTGNLIVFTNTDDVERGNIAMSISRKHNAEGDPMPGVSGHGVLATLTFEVNRGVEEGATRPKLMDVLAVNAAGDEIVVNAYPPDPTDVFPLAVWPGDTDNDGRAGLRDIFPIGNCYGVRGPARGFDLSWMPQAMSQWDFRNSRDEPCTPEVVPNPAFADATGDGLISQNDVLPLGLNLGLTHEAGYDATGEGASAPQTASKLAGEVARLAIDADQAGERHRVAVTVGTESDPIPSLFGIAAQLRLPPRTLRLVAVEAGALLDDGDLLAIDQYSAETGLVEAAYTRKRGAEAVTGHGEVIVVEVEVVQAMTDAVEVVLELAEASLFSSGVVTLTPAQVRLGESATATSAEQESALPGSYMLEAAYPNPSRGTTTIGYRLPVAGDVRLALYDVLGREVALLAEGRQAAGTHQISLESSGLPSGVYLYRMQANGYTETRRLTLLK